MTLTAPSSNVFEQRGCGNSKTTLGVIANTSKENIIKALDSAAKQTANALDLIVIDNSPHTKASTSTLHWIETYALRFNSIKLIQKAGVSLGVAQSNIVELSQTPYILFLEENYSLYPRCIEKCEKYLSANPDAALVYPLIQDEHSHKLFSNAAWQQNILEAWTTINPIFLGRRSHFVAIENCISDSNANAKSYIEQRGLWCGLDAETTYGIQIPEILACCQAQENKPLPALSNVFEAAFANTYTGEIENSNKEGVIEGITANYVVGWVPDSCGVDKLDKINLRIDGCIATSRAYFIQPPNTTEPHRSRQSHEKLRNAQHSPAGWDSPVWFSLRIPDRYLDGREYCIQVEESVEIKDKDSDIHVWGSINYKFEIEGFLDILTQNRVAGWIKDAFNQFPLRLELHINEEETVPFIANLERKDIGESNLCGFDVAFSSQFHGSQTIKITLENSEISLFNTPTVLLSNSGITETLQKMSRIVSLNSDAFSASERRWLLDNLSPQLIDTFRQAAKVGTQSLLKCEATQRITPSYPDEVKVSEIIDVIIPVYKNLAITKRCIQRVMTAKNKTLFNVVVIDDRGPEPEVQEYLSQVSESHQIELLINSENKGFVYSVNLGMSLHPDRDVVLLNSDAIVSDYWLDRLSAAAYSAHNIASVTPLSNHASIFSYPRMCLEVDTLPRDITADQLNELCFQLNDGSAVDVPSMHGFCCFVKRKALLQVGLFDQAKWGKGYGEEVDWSQKAASRGWRHVAAPGVFVEHVGSQSFSDKKDDALTNALKKLSSEYPDFDATVQDFIRRDPLSAHRRQLDIARVKRLSTQYMLFVSHDMDGGIAKHIEDITQRLRQEGIYTLIIKPLHSGWITLSSADDSLDFEAKYNLAHPEEFHTLVEHLKAIGIRHIHIHSTIGYLYDHYIWELPARVGIEYDITIHDYQAICPRVNLTDGNGQYCGEPSVRECDRCIAVNGTYPNPAIARWQRELQTVQSWRQYFYHRFQAARTVFAPSEDAAQRIDRYFNLSNLRLKPHPETQVNIDLRSHNQSRTISVAIIGAISDIKGYQCLYECVTQAKALNYPLKFVVFGYTKNDELFSDLDNIQITGSYSDSDELKRHLINYPCDVAAFFSTWPETYSYTLSEALLSGLVPVGFNIGAFPKRVNNISGAVTLALGSSIKTILDSLLDAGKFARKTAFQGTLAQSKSYSDISMDYYQIRKKPKRANECQRLEYKLAVDP